MELPEKRNSSGSSTSKDISETELPKNSKPEHTIRHLLEQARDCLARYEYQLAEKLCKKALDIDGSDVDVLETCGSVAVELNKADVARQHFEKAVQLSPDNGYEKYMNLGQLYTGAKAVQAFQKGLEIMLKNKEEREKNQTNKECGSADGDGCVTDLEISNGYCSVAEIYMTDCCFDDAAEDHCKENAQKAVDADPKNPEGFLIMANFHLCKDQKQEAKEMIQKSVSLWLPKARAFDQEKTELENVDESLPLRYEAQLTTAKILIEVEEYDTAVEVLECLTDENDEDVEVWYLMGWLCILQDDIENARYYLNKTKRVQKKTGCDLPEVIEHVNQLLEKIGPGEGDKSTSDEDESDNNVDDFDITDDENVS